VETSEFPSEDVLSSLAEDHVSALVTALEWIQDEVTAQSQGRLNQLISSAVETVRFETGYVSSAVLRGHLAASLASDGRNHVDIHHLITRWILTRLEAGLDRWTIVRQVEGMASGVANDTVR
jgi:hypothetical protein